MLIQTLSLCQAAKCSDANILAYSLTAFIINGIVNRCLLKRQLILCALPPEMMRYFWYISGLRRYPVPERFAWKKYHPSVRHDNFNHTETSHCLCFRDRPGGLRSPENRTSVFSSAQINWRIPKSRSIEQINFEKVASLRKDLQATPCLEMLAGGLCLP